MIAGDAVPLWVRVLAWPSTWCWYVVLAILVVYVPLLFPNGRLPSPRWRWVFNALSPVFAIAVVAAMVSVAVRFRRSRGVERQQLKWFLSAVCVSGIGIVVDVVSLGVPDAVGLVLDVVSTVGFIGVPVSITLAILRYRLYEIPRIISRTVTYAAVTAVVFAVDAMIVTLPGALFAAWIRAAWTSRPVEITLCAMVGTSHDWVCGSRPILQPAGGPP